VSLTPIEQLRLAARTSAVVGATFAYLGGCNTESLLSKAQRNRVLDKWVPRWARKVLRIYNFQLDAEGPHVGAGGSYPGVAPNGVGRVFIMNHRSGVDIPITFAVAEARLVSRHDLARWPLVGGGARQIGTLFVDRSSLRSSASVLKEMVRALERGIGVALYPEGTAFAGDEVRAFRLGAFKAAQRTGAEIIPMGIAYADQAAYYGDESFMNHMQRVASMPRLRAALVVGDAIRTQGETIVELRRQAHGSLQTLVERSRQRLQTGR